MADPTQLWGAMAKAAMAGDVAGMDALIQKGAVVRSAERLSAGISALSRNEWSSFSACARSDMS